MAECTGTEVTITPPAPKTKKEQLLEILGMEEIETTMTIDNEDVTVITLGRIVEEEDG